MKFLRGILTLYAIACLCFNSQAQNRTVKIKFEVDSVSSKEIETKLFASTADSCKAIGLTKDGVLELPNMGQTVVDLLVVNKNDTIMFENLPSYIFKPVDQNYEWIFGIDNRPFDANLGLLKYPEYLTDTTTIQIVYWRFSPCEYGDGMEIVEKKEKHVYFPLNRFAGCLSRNTER